MGRSARSEWQPIRIYAEGLQPYTAREYDCVPAWDVVTVHREADAVLPNPDYFKFQSGAPAEDCPDRDKKKYVFWDRHIDKRFHVEYRHATKDSPRVRGAAIKDPDREWDILIEYRDRYLREAGLTPESDPVAVARCLAETFSADGAFKDKALCPVFSENQRAINNGIEGLLFQSHCVGCAKAFAILADSLGIPTRNMGCGGHWVAEAFVGGRWHMADSVGRHPHNRGLPCWFPHSFMEMCLDPMGDHGPGLTHDFRKGLWRRENPQMHLHDGAWASPLTARFSCSNMYAFYPESDRWGIKSDDGKRLWVLMQSGGFYWPTVHDTVDTSELNRLRSAAYPRPLHPEPPKSDYLYHTFREGEKLRQSVWLGELDDVEAVEITLPFAASAVSDFRPDAGRKLVFSTGGFEQSLTGLGAWPPVMADGSVVAAPTCGGNARAVISLPPSRFRANALNWFELSLHGPSFYYVPVLPSALEPYIAPLWSAR